ncbi:MAG TPA: hypothetical protein VFV99_28470 [Kofleriaceae bacterium]|nr:hypothetical protein [Kofleriaceae bacterium]
MKRDMAFVLDVGWNNAEDAQRSRRAHFQAPEPRREVRRYADLDRTVGARLNEVGHRTGLVAEQRLLDELDSFEVREQAVPPIPHRFELAVAPRRECSQDFDRDCRCAPTAHDANEHQYALLREGVRWVPESTTASTLRRAVSDVAPLVQRELKRKIRRKPLAVSLHVLIELFRRDPIKPGEVTVENDLFTPDAVQSQRDRLRDWIRL